MKINRGLLWKIGLPFLGLALLAAFVAFAPQRNTDGASTGDWTCSMHPQIRQPKPGRCPICGMDLVPVSRLSDEKAEAERRMGLEVEAVARRPLFKEIRTVGKLDYNEGRVAYITARIAGRLDRLHVDFVGIPVKKGDHLADVYSPDLFVTQDELIRAVDAYERTADRGPSERVDAARLRDAARTKLELWGMLPEQIREIESSRKPKTHMTLFSPMAGTVVEKSVRVGQYVKEGDMLYRIADLDPLWMYLDVYEYDIGSVRYGQDVTVTFEAYPGKTFRGKVTFIDPFLDDRTRTVKVRVNLPNPDKKLKPAMYANATIRVRLLADGGPAPTGLEGKYVCPMHPEVIRDAPGRCPICKMELLRVPGLRPAGPKDAHAHDAHAGPESLPENPLAVPATAVLDTGRRKIVYRQTAQGYELVELRVGPNTTGKDSAGRDETYYPVLAGLQVGDKVVVRGGFLLDSQTQIEGKPSLLYPQGQSAAGLHSGHGMPAPAAPAPEPHQH